MPLVYVLLGAAVLFLLLQGARWFAHANPHQLAHVIRIAGIVLSGLAGSGLAVTGRLPLAVLALGALAALVIHAVQVNLGGGVGGESAGKKKASEVETEYLRMRLDHESGRLTGQVRKGRFAGRELDDLTLNQLLDLHDEASADDPQSATLLETYLDRAHADWRERAAGRQAGGQARGGGGDLTEEEAWEVLGLKPGASAAEIREAHRRLMLKLHPDHGGSGYLAMRVNQAKDLLLRRRGAKS
jgi:hypothetical protein